MPDAAQDLSDEEAVRIWAQEAQRRLDEYHAGRTKVVPAEEVAKRAESLFQGGDLP